MKRTALTRRTPISRGSASLKRSPIRRKRSKGQPPERRDDAYLAWARKQPCCAPMTEVVREGDLLRFRATTCGHRPCDPHHKHGDGKGIKTHDRTCIPLCRRHHRDAEGKRGPFLNWTKQQTRNWHDEQSALWTARYEREMGNG